MDFHARGVLEHPGGELVAAANWREASLRSLAERHGIPRTTTDWRELAADPDVDAVIIGTPNAPHAPQTIACLAAGRALLDMGVHAIDTVRLLLGDPALESVCARIATRYGDYAVDDDGLLLIGWANGTSSLVESGWWHSHLGGLEADTEVYGTGGYARIWDFTEGPEGYEHCAQPMYSAQVAEFIDAVSEGRQPRPSGEDGAVVMDAVDRAYRSAGIR